MDLCLGGGSEVYLERISRLAEYGWELDLPSRCWTQESS